MHASIGPDDVALLWTQTPRFIQIMNSNSTIQHPHYFFAQTDRLCSVLDCLVEAVATFGWYQELSQAAESVTGLLIASRTYGSLTREQLKLLEDDVRRFVSGVQEIDAFVDSLKERGRLTSIVVESKKRGREIEEDDEGKEVMWSCKRRRSYSEHAFEQRLGFDEMYWLQPPTVQPVGWHEPFSDWM